jgi:hypothetical protein
MPPLSERNMAGPAGDGDGTRVGINGGDDSFVDDIDDEEVEAEDDVVEGVTVTIDTPSVDVNGGNGVNDDDVGNVPPLPDDDCDDIDDTALAACTAAMAPGYNNGATGRTGDDCGVSRGDGGADDIDGFSRIYSVILRAINSLNRLLNATPD